MCLGFVDFGGGEKKQIKQSARWEAKKKRPKAKELEKKRKTTEAAT